MFGVVSENSRANKIIASTIDHLGILNFSFHENHVSTSINITQTTTRAGHGCWDISQMKAPLSFTLKRGSTIKKMSIRVHPDTSTDHFVCLTDVSVIRMIKNDKEKHERTTTILFHFSCSWNGYFWWKQLQ